MLDQVILIEKTKLVSKLLSTVLESNGAKCYVLNELEDFSYLVDDLRPQILLVEVSTLRDDLELFWKAIDNSAFKSFKLVLFGKKDDVDSITNIERFDSKLYKPIDISNIYEQLSSLVE